MATLINPLALLEQAAADESLHPQQFVAPLRAAFQFAFEPNTQRAAADLEPQLFREFLRSQQARDIISRLGISPADFSGHVLTRATSQAQIDRNRNAIRTANQSPEILALRRHLAVQAAQNQVPLQTGGFGGGVPPLVPPTPSEVPRAEIPEVAINLPQFNRQPQPLFSGASRGLTQTVDTFGQGTQNLVKTNIPAPPGSQGFGVPIPGLFSATRAGKQARSQGVNVPGFGRPRSPRSQTGLNLFR